MAHPVTVAIIDDHEAITESVESWIARDPGKRIEVTYSGKTLTGITAEPTAQAVDVLILDLELADGLAVDRIAELAGAGRRIVVYSSHKDEDLIRTLMRAGVGAYITKDQVETRRHLIRAILAVAAGESYVTPNQAGDILASQRPDFSPREIEVMRLWFNGLSKERVAQQLEISVSSVKQYIERARKKYADADRLAPSRRTLQERIVEDGIVEI
jgi:DNA-binding NarL/FixJ family response regulator